MPDIDWATKRDLMAATPFGSAMRSHFLLEDGVAHLNHGSYGATPICVLEIAEMWRRRIERQPTRFMNEELPGKGGFLRRMTGAFATSHDEPGLLRKALHRLSEFLGSPEGMIAFTENTTAGVNSVLRSLPLAPGDEIITTSLAYGAVMRTVEHVCARTGAKPVIVSLRLPCPGPDEIVERVSKAFSGRTRLLVIDHVAAHPGLVMPIDVLARIAREHDAQLLVDGAHGIGVVPSTVDQADADWYVASGHKWLMGPKGSGFICAAPGMEKDIHPLIISHGYGKGFEAEFDWPGTRDFASWLALPAALELIEAIGLDRIRAYNNRLIADALTLCVDRWGTEAAGPASMFGALAAVRLPGRMAPTIENAIAVHDELLAEARIESVVRPMAGALWVRLSAQIYNEPDDYQRLVEAFG